MITAIDHLVLTVRDTEAAAAFYARVLGVQIIRFGEGRLAIQIGRQKINLHHLGQELRNNAGLGSGDVCLLTDQPIDAVMRHLSDEGITICEGPVEQPGAQGPMTSVYFTDPDGNLIEISRYQ